MVRINNVKHMPLHPAAVAFRRYGGERAKPAGDATTEKAAHRTMQGAVTPKKGTCNKRIKSFERHGSHAGAYPRGPGRKPILRWHMLRDAEPCRAIAGQSSHGARRRARQHSRRILARRAPPHASLYTYA